MDITNEYFDKIGQLVQATRDGKINWKKKDHDTIFFEILNDDGQEVLTIIEKTRSRYILTVSNKTTNETIVSVDSFSQGKFQKLLTALFRAANEYGDRHILSFLDSVLKRL